MDKIVKDTITYSDKIELEKESSDEIAAPIAAL